MSVSAFMSAETIMILMIALLCAATTIMMLRRLRDRDTLEEMTDHELIDRHYQEQLKKLNTQEDLALIDKDDLRVMKKEIALRAMNEQHHNETRTINKNTITTANNKMRLFVMVFTPLFSLGLYMVMGTPHMINVPSQGSTSQGLLPADQTNQDLPIFTYIKKVEAHLEANPNDTKGWAVLAPIYLRFGMVDKARLAYEQVLRLSGSTPELEAALEALQRAQKKSEKNVEQRAQ